MIIISIEFDNQGQRLVRFQEENNDCVYHTESPFGCDDDDSDEDLLEAGAEWYHETWESRDYIIRPPFFQHPSKRVTEVYTPNGEIFIFGDIPENITEETPVQFVGRDNTWGDGSEETDEFPIPDGFGVGNVDWLNCQYAVCDHGDLYGTAAKETIRKWFSWNAPAA